MPNARKQPSGNWRCKAKYHGKAKSFTAGTKREAELLASQWVNGLKGNESDITLDEALNGYIESKRAVLSPSTVRTYEQIRRRYFADLSPLKLSTLTTIDLQRFVSDISLTRSPKTVRNIYGFLVSALQMYMPEKSFKVTLPQKTPVKRTVPTDDQINTLINNSDGDLRTAIILGSFGLRRGEACALTYEDLYPDMGFIEINKDIVLGEENKWIVKKMPKTSSSFRVVRMPKEVIESFGTGSGQIIPRNPRAISHAFERLCKKLQIDITFHSLRRYMASILHALGFPDKYIQDMGGWSSPTIMQRCYENVLVDKNVEYTRQMNDYYKENILKKA